MIYKSHKTVSPPDLAAAEHVVSSMQKVFDTARTYIKTLVEVDGKFDAEKGNAHQPALHGLAYLACELAAAREILSYARRRKSAGGRTDLEELIALAYIGQCARRWTLGSDISGLENIAAAEMGITEDVLRDTLHTNEVRDFLSSAGESDLLSAIAEVVEERGTFGDFGIDDELLRDIQAQFAKFSDNVVAPIAEKVHRKDTLIPLDIVAQLAEQGVFGITIPEQYGGTELGKMGMVVVTEELTRGYIGVGSLGTRAEIAAELILTGGTQEQKDHWLPKIAAGEVLPTAVFTEPNFGSDLAGVTTRATKTDAGTWRVQGQKTWITHGSRADLMTLLARTLPD
ncbi:acyl-CoA/acyl-ACP dehydrogenase, partial [bacterium]|nr:acyl-CoA/acyl-ACP dehydrogenase [bacterium]